MSDTVRHKLESLRQTGANIAAGTEEQENQMYETKGWEIFHLLLSVV